jgi:hypothetical protein
MEVFLNFILATSIEGIHLGMAELGATQSSQVAIFDGLMESNLLFLTGNTDAVYASTFLKGILLRGLAASIGIEKGKPSC